MAKSNRPVNRRGFLKGAVTAAAGAAALVGEAPAVAAQQAETPRPPGLAPSPTAVQLAAETGPVSIDTDGMTVENPGSDFMVDVLKSLGFEYVASNPGSSFRSLQESFINYGGNKSPEWLTCCHEESSVAIADGYFRVEGKPMAVMAHGTVGLQHAAMTIYNAFVAAIPVYIILGNALDANDAPAGSGVEPQRPGCGVDGPRLHQVGRHADFADAFCRVGGARLQDRHDGADGAGHPRGRRRSAGKRRSGDRSKLRIPKLTLTEPAGRRSGGGRGSGEAARRRGEPGDCRRPRRAHPGGHEADGRARRNAAGAGAGRRAQHAQSPSAQRRRFAWATRT